MKEAIDVPIVEALVIPVHIGDQALRTIWILSHDEGVHFDSEDARIMTGLAGFTASAILQVHALHFETQGRKQAEIEAAAGKSLARKLKRSQSNLE